MEKNFDIFADDLCPYDIVKGLGIDETMSMEEISERVFNAFREVYDGQVCDNVVMDMCDSTIKDICECLDELKED